MAHVHGSVGETADGFDPCDCVRVARLGLGGGRSASRGLVENTLWLVGATLLASIPIGTALAVALARTDAWLRRSVAVAIGIMLVVPLYLDAAAWDAGFGDAGWFTALVAPPYSPGLLSGWRGAVWVHSLAAIPWVVLIVGMALRFVEPELEEAALLDCSAWRVLRRVTLRRALPAIGIAAVWVAVGVGTEMTVTDIFQTPGNGLRTYAEEIYTQFALGTEPGPPPGAMVGVAVTSCLAACGLMLCLAAASWTPPTSRPPLVFHLGRWRWLVSAALVLSAIAIFGVPLISLIAKAGVTVQLTGRQTTSAAGRLANVLGSSPEAPSDFAGKFCCRQQWRPWRRALCCLSRCHSAGWRGGAIGSGWRRNSWPLRWRPRRWLCRGRWWESR